MKNPNQYSYTYGFFPSTSLEEDFEKEIPFIMQINVRTSDFEYRMRNGTYVATQKKYPTRPKTGLSQDN